MAEKIRERGEMAEEIQRSWREKQLKKLGRREKQRGWSTEKQPI